MPRKYELMWHKALKKWFKIIDGKMVYFTSGKVNKTDQEAYHQALEKYYLHLDKKPEETPKPTVARKLHEYIQYVESRADGKYITVARYLAIKNRFHTMSKIFSFDLLTPRKISDYQGEIQRKEAWSLSYQKQMLNEIKLFYQWAKFSVEGYEPIYVPRPIIRTLTAEQIFAIINESQPLLKVCVLLAINCGYTQQDIATLTKEMIHDDRIIRHRTKTGVLQEHLLWPETITALELFLAASGEHSVVFLNSKGKPLVSTNKTNRQDHVQAYYKRVAKRNGITGGFKLIRKSGAQLLSDSGCPLEIIQLYLAHTPSTVAQAHYYHMDPRKLDPWLLSLRDRVIGCEDWNERQEAMKGGHGGGIRNVEEEEEFL